MDVKQIKAQMILRDVDAHKASTSLGISVSTWYRKLRGASDFTHPEMVSLCDLLGIDNPASIFFEHKVS